jgi:hypothetical protein
MLCKKLFLFNFDVNVYARAAAAAFDAAFDAAADAAFAAAADADFAWACAFCIAFDAAAEAAFAAAAAADLAAAFDALILLAIDAKDLFPPLRVRCLREPLLRRDAILYILFIKKIFKRGINYFLNNYKFLKIL